MKLKNNLYSGTQKQTGHRKHDKMMTVHAVQV